MSLLTFVMCGCHGNLPQMMSYFITLVNIINIKNAIIIARLYMHEALSAQELTIINVHASIQTL